MENHFQLYITLINPDQQQKLGDGLTNSQWIIQYNFMLLLNSDEPSAVVPFYQLPVWPADFCVSLSAGTNVIISESGSFQIKFCGLWQESGVDFSLCFYFMGGWCVKDKHTEALLTCLNFHSCSCSDSLGLSGSLNAPSVSMETGS